jgi:hypothetical protein
VFTVPAGSEAVLIESTAGLIVSARSFVAFWLPLSNTWTVKLAGPAEVGVPLITPFVGDNARPAGKAPAVTDQPYGVVPPVTDTGCE